MAALLWPREHGTYGEILFPLATALLIGRPGVTAWSLCVVALAGFFAHEALVVLAGRRGDRARRDSKRRAQLSLMSFGAAGIAGGLVAVATIETPTTWAAMMAVLLAVVALTVAWRGAERSLMGELVAVVALTAWCAPIALAGQLPLNASIGLWLIWCAVFALGTTAVESVVARSTRRSPRLGRILCVMLGIVASGGALLATRAEVLPPDSVWTLIPAIVVSLTLAAGPFHARHLRRIGWSMIVVSVLTLGLMLKIFANPL